MERRAAALLLLLAMSGTVAAGAGCRIEDCIRFYNQILDGTLVRPAASLLYCQTLEKYRQCAAERHAKCHEELRFRYVSTALRAHWSKYECERILATPAVESRCEVSNAAAPQTVRFCALFGASHVRKFDGETQTTTLSGTRPFVDNRFFLVQVTFSPTSYDSFSTTLTRIIVIIKSTNCTNGRALVYEASSDTEHLPQSFVDGGHAVLDWKNQKIVEVHQTEQSAIVIFMKHCDSSIHIRRFGSRLSVAVRGPENVVTRPPSVDGQLCISGFHGERLVSLNDFFADALGFAKCHALRFRVPLSLAAARCIASNLTDLFLDTCTADLALTGDENFVASSRSALRDIRLLYPHYQYIERGRSQISTHQHRQLKWTRCRPVAVPSVSPRMSNLGLILVFLTML